MSKYYITIDKNDVIWGCGESPEQSLLDAENNFAEVEKTKRRPKFKTLECTKELYDDVFVNGYCHGEDEPYWLYDGMVRMAYYPQKTIKEPEKQKQK